MQELILEKRPHTVKVGDQCGPIAPNVTEDTLFIENGEPIGFYLADVSRHSRKLYQLLHLANQEFNSDRVPKSEMRRSSGLVDESAEVKQYSTIIGSVPAKPNMRRNNHRISSVHGVPSAKTFIKAMMLLAHESEEVIRKYTPNIFERQKAIIEKEIPKQWRFGRLFTSSISNYNIAAPFHVDAANLRGCVNVILVKKKLAHGGNTTVPDYGATVDSADNSMLVYPAWYSLHGVTPIEPQRANGYRNSLVFYPLKAFRNG